jgi:hypothetical protein
MFGISASSKLKPRTGDGKCVERAGNNQFKEYGRHGIVVRNVINNDQQG